MKKFLLMLAASATMLSAQPVDQSMFQDLSWRLIGPFRGGRTVAATGVPQQPGLFYIGVNNGGVWKTTDYGRTWDPIFDEPDTGSIGALAVAPSNPDVMYVGSGEGLHRPDLSVGDGMFKSTDAGITWSFLGLDDAQQITDIVIHPENPDVVYVSVLGHPYGPNVQRGVFKTVDGGKTWQKVFFIDENTGAVGLVARPGSPNVLYASMWNHQEGPWENANWTGPNSGLYITEDGGDTWRKLTGGLPTGNQGLGRIGLGISPSSPNRMYATVQANEMAGLYRSDDFGTNWERVSDDNRVYGRAGDFAELKVHPFHPEIVFSGNIAGYRSDDGGYTWTSIVGAPGGDDYHRIWIHPEKPEIMLWAADQGAIITVNGGESWSSWYNQPTAQLYHVTTDNQYPYHVYGGQQESGAIGVTSMSEYGQITFRDWYSVRADEYAYVAPDPLNPDIIYGGRVTKYNKKTGQVQNVAPEAVRSSKYRILRTMPLQFSPVDKKALYFATNVLWKTTNGGTNWTIVSPDLSRERPDIPESVGIYKTPEMADMARRGVIYSLGLSPLNSQLIWAGTDDGLVHVSKDGGATWTDVTPPQLTSWSKIAQLDPGHFNEGTAYIAVNRFRLDDQRPYVYRTHDFGQTWDLVVDGLPVNGPLNVVREDPQKPGLLYAGSERSVYVSFDDGDSWQSLRLNLPSSSVRDLVVHEDDLVVGTHGRSIWILDNVTPLRQIAEATAASSGYLFEPKLATRVRWNMYTDTPFPPDEPAGQNPPDGAMIDYWLPEEVGEVRLQIIDRNGVIIRSFSSNDKPEAVDPNDHPHPMYWVRPPMMLKTEPGMHRFVWDLHHAPPPGVDRSFPISAVYKNTVTGPHGPWVLPGTYRVRLIIGDQTDEQMLRVRLDPRVNVGQNQLVEQYELSMDATNAYFRVWEIRETASEIQLAIADRLTQTEDNTLKQGLESLSSQLSALIGRGRPDLPNMHYSSVSLETKGEETLAGLQQQLIYLIELFQEADAAPTNQGREGLAVVKQVVSDVTDRWNSLLITTIREVNRQLADAGLVTLN